MTLNAIIDLLLSTKSLSELRDKWGMGVHAICLFRKRFFSGNYVFKNNNLAKKAEAFGYKKVQDEFWAISLDDIQSTGFSDIRPLNRLEDLKNFSVKHDIEIYKLDNKFCCYIDFYEGCKPYSEEDNSFLALLKGVENYIKQHGR